MFWESESIREAEAGRGGGGGSARGLATSEQLDSNLRGSLCPFSVPQAHSSLSNPAHSRGSARFDRPRLRVANSSSEDPSAVAMHLFGLQHPAEHPRRPPRGASEWRRVLAADDAQAAGSAAPKRVARACAEVPSPAAFSGERCSPSSVRRSGSSGRRRCPRSLSHSLAPDPRRSSHSTALLRSRPRSSDC